IIILGGGYYYYTTTKTAPAAPPGTPAPVVSQQSLAGLVSAGQPVTCTFSTTTQSGEMHGTVYVAGGMVAGDFTTAMGTSSIDAHMLVRDNTSYVWTSLSNQGFKSTVTNSATTSSSERGVEYGTPMTYSCSNWSVDASKFTLPGNISFSATPSFTAPPQGAGATGAATGVKGTAEMCAKCNSLPSSQKAQCIAALQC